MIKSKRFGILFFPALLFMLTYFVFGFYYEENDDAVFSHLLRGTFFKIPVTDFFIYHKYTAHLYAWLYGQWSNIPWYSLIMYMYLLAALIMYFAVISRWLERYTTLSASVRLVILYSVFFFSLMGSLVFLNFTRVALLLGSASIFLLAEFVYFEENKIKWYKVAACWLAFIIAMLTRMQAALLCVGLIGPFIFLIYNCHSVVFRKMLYVFLPLLIFIGGFKISERFTQDKSSAYYKEVTPYLFNILDAYYSYFPKNYSTADSMRYEAVNRWMLGDRATVNKEFLSRITTEKQFDTAKFSRQKVVASVSGIAGYADKSQLVALGVLFLLLAVIFIRGWKQKETRRLFFRLILFNLIFFGALVFIAVFIKMLPRVLGPMLHIAIACHLFAVLSSFNLRIPVMPRRGIVAVCALVLLLTFFVGYKKVANLKFKEGNLREKITANNMLAQSICNNFKNEVLVFHLQSLSDLMLYQPVFSVNGFSMENTYLLYDGGWTSLMGPYPAHLKMVCGSEKFSDVFPFLVRQKERVCFISSPERNQLLLAYIEKVYGQRYSVIEFTPPGIATGNRNIKFYRLRQ